MEIKRENNNNEDKEDEYARKRATNPDEYGRKVSKMAVAQICESIGFDSVKQSSLQALSEIALRFISDLGKSSNYYANLAGRSQSNVVDILKASQDLCGTSSMSDFIQQQKEELVMEMEAPFANPIPRFPVISRNLTKNRSPSFLQLGEEKIKHIPDWLPVFPDEHTYISSPLWSQRKVDLRIDKGEQARQRRKAEKSLLNLQQRLLSNANVCGNDQVEVVPAKGKGKGNKDVLVKQMFAPAIEALLGVGTQEGSDADVDVDGMDIDRRVVPGMGTDKGRRPQPVVHFKLRAGKRMLVEDLDIYLKSKVVERRSSLWGRDDDKDDKKRRAEMILRQSAMDNQPQEVSQM